MATEMDYPDPYPLLLDTDLSIEDMQRLGPKKCFHKLAEKVRQTHEQVNFVAVGAHQALETLVHKSPHLAQMQEYQELQAQVKRCSKESEDFYDQILTMCKSAEMDISHAFANGTFRTTATPRDWSFAGKQAIPASDKTIPAKRTRRTKKEMAEFRAKALSPALSKQNTDSGPAEPQINSSDATTSIVKGAPISNNGSGRTARLVPIVSHEGSFSSEVSDTSDEAPHITILDSQGLSQRVGSTETIARTAEASDPETVTSASVAKRRKVEGIPQQIVPDSQSQLESAGKADAVVPENQSTTTDSDSESEDARISFHSATEPVTVQPSTPDRRSSSTSSCPAQETPPPPSGIVSSPATLARRTEEQQQALLRPSTQDSTYAMSLPSRSPSPLLVRSEDPKPQMTAADASSDDESDTEDEVMQDREDDFADNPMYAHLDKVDTPAETPTFGQLNAEDTDSSAEDQFAERAKDPKSPSPPESVAPLTPDGSFHPNQAQAAQQESRRSRTSTVRRIDFGDDEERAFVERLQSPERSFSATQSSGHPASQTDQEGGGIQTAAAKRRADRSARKRRKAESIRPPFIHPNGTSSPIAAREAARPAAAAAASLVDRPERSGPALTQASPTPHRVTRSKSPTKMMR